ncbi:hypothetical protein DCAR_0625761 [Daucus carota subsp. sativus]|uniref:PsbP C-terminal domain-containing protein n=1 Tax=Daucus carota subsp. sativus TaxID=79200 RepID=A0AAF1B7P7_DAUCS|nr:PREDICTED: psbP domain-containing protein 6, chloroplastic [Daucus carota subsp. sativus]WOH06336.1 hypothetical protein DCAR_0625761 [Daucus carota subsp. sativus]
MAASAVTHLATIFTSPTSNSPSPSFRKLSITSTLNNRIITNNNDKKPCSQSFNDDHTTTRREFLKSSSAMLAPMIVTSTNSPAAEAREVEVGSFLPPAPSDPSFVLFKATTKDTPALRAGNVEPYQFVIPPTWKQDRIANILSGNYCQPKCAEPWIEVKFENDKQGKIQVVASPLIRLTNKPNATIEDIGSPEKLIASLGAFVTGNTYDSDELIETSIEKIGDQTYYKYVLETPFALTGSHNLAKATAKGNTVILFVVSATDKQWPSSQKTLKTILDSFRV